MGRDGPHSIEKAGEISLSGRAEVMTRKSYISSVLSAVRHRDMIDASILS